MSLSFSYPAAITVPPSPVTHKSTQSLPLHSLSLRSECVASAGVPVSNPKPVFSTVRSFAPATVANLGPGFDFLGCAIDGLGDHVTVRLDPHVRPGEVSISEIEGVSSTTRKLSKDPISNCAGIAATAVMKMLGIRSVGVSLCLHKGLPLGSGLGSSAASAAAAASAVNELFGNKLSPSDLILAGLESESKVSGYHADNVAPAIMGGFVLIRSYDPLDVVRLDFPSEVYFVLVTPDFEAPTRKMRAALPTEVDMSHHVWNCSQAAALVASVLQGNVEGFGRALSSDKIVEPRRAPLVPGMESVKKAAVAAGAFGCTISGAGPTAVAVTDDVGRGREIGMAMVDAFMIGGKLKAYATVSRLDHVGARAVCRVSL